MNVEVLRVRVPVSELESTEAIQVCAATKLKEDRKETELPTIRVVGHRLCDYSQVDANNTLLVEVQYQELPVGVTEWPPLPDMQALQVVKTIRGKATDGRLDPANRFRRDNRNPRVPWRQDTNDRG